MITHTNNPENPEPDTHPVSDDDLRPGLLVLHGNRLEDLRDLLTEHLRRHPLPPLSPEIILVQSNGMKQWLEMALADEQALGICAATRLDLPSTYVWEIYRKVLGADQVPQRMPFDKSALLWRLVRLLPEVIASKPVYEPLQRYLGARQDGRRLYQLALQVADVLDGYQSYRADWLADWGDGHELLRGHDGAALPLPEVHRWQAQLWRDIQVDVGPTLAQQSRAGVHTRFMAAMRTLADQAPASRGNHQAGLPARVVVFGISSLPMQTVEALAALGQVCQVFMLVQNPCRHYWGNIVEGHELLRQQWRRRQRPKALAGTSREDDELHTASHPLLASWGKQVRDYLHLLDGFDDVERYQDHFSRVDLFTDPVADVNTPEPATQLQQLQSSILNLQASPAGSDLTADDSITFLTAHTAQRELEVLHDRLWRWFDAQPDLAPRDVMVMVPDMTDYAPRIQAVFGRFASGHARHIPYTVADTTARQSPLVQALSQLLMLPSSRLTLADWLGLFEVPAVRQRFDLTEADVLQLQEWLSAAGVRWGLDASHRKAWGMPDNLPDLDQNTWAFALRRLLLGYAVGDGPAWSGTLPMAALGSLDARLIGAVLHWTQAIDSTLRDLSGEHTPAQWADVLRNMMQRFFKADDDAQERLMQRCLTPLDNWLELCDDAQLHSPLALDVVREHWLAHLDEGGLHQRFLGGGVQFGTLMPMRSIPFKVICLLGMNDGDYPRQKAPRDFDLMSGNWRAGDRSRREDDRYLFLEALLAARQRLYISWRGNRATDNSEQPPSVLVAQLLDYLNDHWHPCHVPERHALQPYSEAYFRHGAHLETYDSDWRQVHSGSPLTAPPKAAHADEGASNAGGGPNALTLTDLQQLLRQPVEVFFRARLQIRFDEVQDLSPPEEPFDLNSLESYHVGQAALAAENTDEALSRMKLSGTLPMAAWGEQIALSVQRNVQVVRLRQVEWEQQYPHVLQPQPVNLVLDDTALTGALTGLRGGSDGALMQMEQRVGAVAQVRSGAKVARGQVLIRLWINHLAACASGLPMTSVQLGLNGQVVFDRLPSDQALAMLQTLVRVYRQAWQRPLPCACKTAWAFVQAQACADKVASEDASKPPPDPHEAARTEFEGGFQITGEQAQSAYLRRCFDSYDDLAAELPTWATQLYGDMARHARLTMTEETSA